MGCQLSASACLFASAKDAAAMSNSSILLPISSTEEPASMPRRFSSATTSDQKAMSALAWALASLEANMPTPVLDFCSA